MLFRIPVLQEARCEFVLLICKGLGMRLMGHSGELCTTWSAFRTWHHPLDCHFMADSRYWTLKLLAKQKTKSLKLEFCPPPPMQCSRCMFYLYSPLQLTGNVLTTVLLIYPLLYIDLSCTVFYPHCRYFLLSTSTWSWSSKFLFMKLTVNHLGSGAKEDSVLLSRTNIYYTISIAFCPENPRSGIKNAWCLWKSCISFLFTSE